MNFSLLPKEEQYFDLLDQAAHYVAEGAALLQELIENFTDVESKVERIKGIEHACDEVLHNTLDRLNKTYVTPIDREDIHALAIALDDVLDMTNEAATRLVLFRVTDLRPPLRQFAEIIRKQADIIREAVREVRHPKRWNQIERHIIELHRLENEADDLMKHAVAALFEKETNAIELIKWKEIYEMLETVTDHAEDVANVLQAITVKMA